MACCLSRVVTFCPNPSMQVVEILVNPDVAAGTDAETFECPILVAPIGAEGAITATGRVYDPTELTKWLSRSDVDPATAKTLVVPAFLRVPAPAIPTVLQEVREGAFLFYVHQRVKVLTPVQRSRVLVDMADALSSVPVEVCLRKPGWLTAAVEDAAAAVRGHDAAHWSAACGADQKTACTACLYAQFLLLAADRAVASHSFVAAALHILVATMPVAPMHPGFSASLTVRLARVRHVITDLDSGREPDLPAAVAISHAIMARCLEHGGHGAHGGRGGGSSGLPTRPSHDHQTSFLLEWCRYVRASGRQRQFFVDCGAFLTYLATFTTVANTQPAADLMREAVGACCDVEAWGAVGTLLHVLQDAAAVKGAERTMREMATCVRGVLAPLFEPCMHNAALGVQVLQFLNGPHWFLGALGVSTKWLLGMTHAHIDTVVPAASVLTKVFVPNMADDVIEVVRRLTLLPLLPDHPDTVRACLGLVRVVVPWKPDVSVWGPFVRAVLCPVLATSARDPALAPVLLDAVLVARALPVAWLQDLPDLMDSVADALRTSSHVHTHFVTLFEAGTKLFGDAVAPHTPQETMVGWLDAVWTCHAAHRRWPAKMFADAITCSSKVCDALDSGRLHEGTGGVPTLQLTRPAVVLAHHMAEAGTRMGYNGIKCTSDVYLKAATILHALAECRAFKHIDVPLQVFAPLFVAAAKALTVQFPRDAYPSLVKACTRISASDPVPWMSDAIAFLDATPKRWAVPDCGGIHVQQAASYVLFLAWVSRSLERRNPAKRSGQLFWADVQQAMHTCRQGAATSRTFVAALLEVMCRYLADPCPCDPFSESFRDTIGTVMAPWVCDPRVAKWALKYMDLCTFRVASSSLFWHANFGLVRCMGHLMCRDEGAAKMGVNIVARLYYDEMVRQEEVVGLLKAILDAQTPGTKFGERITNFLGCMQLKSRLGEVNFNTYRPAPG